MAVEVEYPRLEVIVAADRNLGIGKDNKLPWRLPSEFAYYRGISSSKRGSDKVHASIYATKTWLSIPPESRPWGNTICFIISRSLKAEDVRQYRDVYVHSSLQEVIDHLRRPEMRERIDRVWVHGGAFGYAEALRSPHFYRLYRTKIHAEYPADTFFPRYDESCLKVVQDPDTPQGIQHDNGVDYEVVVYETTGVCPLME